VLLFLLLELVFMIFCCKSMAIISTSSCFLCAGDTRILRADILLDCGKSLNPAVDIGQVKKNVEHRFSFFSSKGLDMILKPSQ
jgi:hypothetical protein